MVKLTEDQIKTVMKQTGAKREYVLSIAERVPESIRIWFPGRIILSVWSCVRCALCLGPARKVFWCIVCTILSHPVIG